MTAPATRTTHVLYLHGFRSSPQSTKARMMAAAVAQRHPAVHWWCPQLPPSPREAMALVMDGIQGWPRDRMAVVGSSLGGFYAACVSGAMGCRAVLLNPAVHPARDLARHLGEHSGWHDPEQRFTFTEAHVQELRMLEDASRDALREPRPAHYALIAQGDEVLSWQEMTARHPHATLRLLGGSDHAISDFAQYLDEVLDFLQLA
ncbi:MAG: hypothetical protein RL087_253 [Pseudomonadota bacterium]|jgi:predicted esterase YcpF (UPF0227 family)